MNDTLIKVEGVSKKFCRSLKRSLWYGVQDLGKEVLGRRHGGNGELRPEEFWANKDISFEVKRGETIGLIGHNGAGKTTLLRMLNGLIKPDAGYIEIRGRMQALIALGAGFNPILTGRENLYVNSAVLGFSKKEIERKFDEIVDFSGVNDFIDTPVQSYSSGMVVRLGFAVAVQMEPVILLVDEVLAVGDETFQSKCLNKIGELKNKGTAIILVSHNMHTMSVFSSRVIVMERGISKSFSDVHEGISFYRKNTNNNNNNINKICSGNEFIKFYFVDIENNKLHPCDDIKIILKYESKKKYLNVEIDMTIYSNNDTGQYYQATNHVYNNKIDINKGTGEISITLHNVQINNSQVTMGLSIWSENRADMLFWWRVPFSFAHMPGSNGKNFLPASISQKVF